VVTRRGEDARAVAVASYVCPMHPEVRASSPDEPCSICRMALEPAKAGAVADASVDRSPSDDAYLVLSADAPLRLPHDAAFVARRVRSRVIRAPARFETPHGGIALVYRDDAARLAPEGDALFVPAAGSPPVRVRLTRDRPSVWDHVTSVVRFRAARPAATPNQWGFLELAPRICRETVVPHSAVLRSPDGAYVFVVGTDNRTLTRRRIEIGNVLFGYASVVSGLAAGERVATMNAFFLDAEWRLRRGLAR